MCSSFHSPHTHVWEWCQFDTGSGCFGGDSRRLQYSWLKYFASLPLLMLPSAPIKELLERSLYLRCYPVLNSIFNRESDGSGYERARIRSGRGKNERNMLRDLTLTPVWMPEWKRKLACLIVHWPELFKCDSFSASLHTRFTAPRLCSACACPVTGARVM